MNNLTEKDLKVPRRTQRLNIYQGINQHSESAKQNVLLGSLNGYVDERGIWRARPGTTIYDAFANVFGVAESVTNAIYLDSNGALQQYTGLLNNKFHRYIARWEKVYFKQTWTIIMEVHTPYKLTISGQDYIDYAQDIYYARVMPPITMGAPGVPDYGSWHFICRMGVNPATVGDFLIYPCTFLVFRNMLWITNGKDPVMVWNGLSTNYARPVFNKIADDGLELMDSEKGADIFIRGRFACIFKHKIWFGHTPRSPTAIVHSKFRDDNANLVYPDEEDAWDALNITDMTRLVEIRGIRPLTENSMLIGSSEGNFELLFRGDEPIDLRPMDNIRCSEGNYYKTKTILSFEQQTKKIFSFNGRAFVEDNRIEDILLSENLPIPEQWQVNSQEEWKTGHFDASVNGSSGNPLHVDCGKTTADWYKGALTPDYEIKENLEDNIKDESFEDDPSPPTAKHCHISRGRRGSATSVVIQAWEKALKDEEEVNIPKMCVGVSLRLYQGLSYDSELRAELIEYDTLPEIFGKGNFRVIAKHDFVYSLVGSTDWVKIFWDNPVPLKMGKIYYLSLYLTNPPSFFHDLWWLSNDPEGLGVNGNSFLYNGEAHPENQRLFKLWYAGATIDKDCYYYSEIFGYDTYGTNVTGRLFSADVDMNKDSDNNDCDALEYQIWFRARASTFNWNDDSSTTGWVENNSGYGWVEIDNIEALKFHYPSLNYCYIQFRIRLKTTNKYVVPKVYFARVDLIKQRGQLEMFQDDNNDLYLMLQNNCVVFPKTGWYNCDGLNLTSLIHWIQNDGKGLRLWGTTGTAKKQLYDISSLARPYFLGFDDGYLHDYQSATEDYQADNLYSAITMRINFGVICGGNPEEYEEMQLLDKIFHELRIYYVTQTVDKTNRMRPIPFSVDWWTEQASDSKGIGAMDNLEATTDDREELHLFTFNFHQAVGKFLHLIVSQTKGKSTKILNVPGTGYLYTQIGLIKKIKMIELEYELRRKDSGKRATS